MIIDRKRFPGLLAYKVKGRQEYLIVDETTLRVDGSGRQVMDGYGAVTESVPGAVSCTCGRDYLRDNCTEVSWKKIPAEWQEQFRDALVPA